MVLASTSPIPVRASMGVLPNTMTSAKRMRLIRVANVCLSTVIIASMLGFQIATYRALWLGNARLDEQLFPLFISYVIMFIALVILSFSLVMLKRAKRERRRQKLKEAIDE